MQAIIYETYGSADVLQLKTVAKPVPQANEVVVKIHASSANTLDWRMMRATPFLARLDNGLFKPKETRLGADLAGRVEAVGSEVTRFRLGDEVMGDNFRSGLGAFAEYVSVAEDRLVLKPSRMSFEEAAAVPLAAMTALQGLQLAQIKPGQKVLINGASGGVGSFAVQIAKAFGAEVTGVCSTRNVELVRSIGADHVIDYTQEDFTANGQQYDVILCAVGNHSLAEYKRALSTEGVGVIVGFSGLARMFSHLIFGSLKANPGQKRVGIMDTVASNPQDLETLRGLLDAGKVTPVIDRRYALHEVPDALRYLETGRARGKVVITVNREN
jgi:NADPH:quinone reductase-like Zn-dependent oxidoreductase